MLSLWHSIAAFFSRFILRYLYGWWSRVYRTLWEGAYAPGSKQDLDFMLRVATAFETLDTLSKYVASKARMWKADSWKQLFDAVSYPARADALLDARAMDTAGLDCDEFATWLTVVLRMHANVWGIEEAQLLTVTWMTPDGSIAGHNVCGIRWSGGKRSYMDYGTPSARVTTREEVVAQVLARYAPKGKLLSWAMYDPLNMKTLEVH